MGSYIVEAFIVVIDPWNILILLSGILTGIIFGAIPGLTATLAISLLLPVTFGMTPVVGMLLLCGVWVGGVSGSLISATLIGIPGTPSSIATTFDAYPLTQKGQAVKALGIGIVASFIGSVASISAAMVFSPIIARLALTFGPWEYFALGIAAISFIGSFTKEDVFRGLAAGFLGLSFTVIGMAPIDGNPRFDFGYIGLRAGIGILPLILGIFAIAQIVRDFGKGQPPVDSDFKITGFGIIGVTVKELISNGVNIIRSFLIGLWIGFLPGMGSGLSNMVAYAQAKSSSKKPEEFGKGSIEGIFASEVANNASLGGALIPMLTLGIPGDSVTAILLGGLMIHGIQPGPLLLVNQPALVQVVFISCLTAAVLTFFIQVGGMRLFPLILKIPYRFIYPPLIIMSFVGAFASNNRYFDIWVMLAFGVVGILIALSGIPVSPFILGFVLGPMIETNLRRGLTYSDGNFMIFLTRPISGTLLALAVFSVVWPNVKKPLLMRIRKWKGR